MYPKVYDPSYALGACILAIVFVAAFALIFPLIGLPVVLLIFLTLIAHRFLVGYVFGRTDSSQTGGLLQLWVLRRFATLLALQPLLLGLLLLSRKLWVLGGIMIGVAILIICAVEGYASWRLRKPGRRALSAVTRHSLRAYENSARPRLAMAPSSEEKSTVTNTSDRPRRRNAHTSISSVLDMMNITLAVMPSPARNRGPVPLRKSHSLKRISPILTRYDSHRALGRSHCNGKGCSDTSRCPPKTPTPRICRRRRGNGWYPLPSCTYRSCTDHLAAQ